MKLYSTADSRINPIWPNPFQLAELWDDRWNQNTPLPLVSQMGSMLG